MREIVATYDYYTLEQAERILYRRNSAQRKRKERIKFNVMMFTFYVVAPAYLIISWAISGY